MIPTPCPLCQTPDSRYLFEKDNHQFYGCRRCALIFISPQPSDETLGGIYGKKYYDAWGVQHDAGRVMALKKETFRRHVLATMNLPERSRVLDCGAAFGTLMEAAAEKNWQPYGIELASEAAAEIARQFGEGRVYSGPFEQASFPDAPTFEAVFMCDFIEHVREPLAVLKKAATLMSTGGQLVITTPDGGSLSRRLMKSGWPHYKVEHLHYFNRRNIAMLLEKAGFKTTEASSARKVLSFDYIRHQFNTYPRWLITPFFNVSAYFHRGVV